jgi:predicted transcriptional regulator
VKSTTKIYLDRDLGIEICLACPYDDCTYNNSCDLIEGSKKSKQQDRMQILVEIKEMLKSKDEIPTTILKEKFNINQSAIQNFIKRGELEVTKKKGRNSLRIVRVNLKKRKVD